MRALFIDAWRNRITGFILFRRVATLSRIAEKNQTLLTIIFVMKQNRNKTTEKQKIVVT